ncbi:MAG: threonine-phosphate decarboxylase CobD [Methyloceanibacter sp.]|nr:threonine-phosphate decarboxylase CobD [Methyloceanibacter sp.]
MHGGDLGAARSLFPNAPEPIVDLSTGVNPHPYPIVATSAEDFARLPEPAALSQVSALASDFYGAPSAENIVVAPGSQILVALMADLIPKGRAAILGPTYAEHARVVALAGHEVRTVATPAELNDAALAVVVNPNNPDGCLTPRDDLKSIAERSRAHGGLLIVDEAFMDVGPEGETLCGCVEEAPIAALRSFGKFFGLAGLRLSFAVTNRDFAARLRARLGPWPVSGPALAIGTVALQDSDWIDSTRSMLRVNAERLKSLLQGAGLTLVGMTDLFCLVTSSFAQEAFMKLGEAGIVVRRFDENQQILRFGLPGKETEWRRLNDALQALS